MAYWNRPHIFLQSAAPKAKGSCCYWRHNSQGSLFPHRVVIDNTIGCATDCGGPVGWGCYSLHILKRGVPAGCFPEILHAGLLFSAHFSHCRCACIYHNTADFLFSISSCYCLHILRFYRRFPRVSSTADKENAGLLSTAQFYVQRFSFGFQIAYPPTAQANTTWPAKIPLRAPLKKFSSSPLLSSAHFQNLKNPFHFSPPTIAQQKYFCGNLCCE